MTPYQSVACLIALVILRAVIETPRGRKALHELRQMLWPSDDADMGIKRGYKEAGR